MYKSKVQSFAAEVRTRYLCRWRPTLNHKGGWSCELNWRPQAQPYCKCQILNWTIIINWVISRIFVLHLPRPFQFHSSGYHASIYSSTLAHCARPCTFSFNMLGSHSKLSIALIILYVPVILLAIYLACYRHIRPRMVWIILIFFSVSESHKSIAWTSGIATSLTVIRFQSVSLQELSSLARKKCPALLSR